jgi:hypothetical protein
MYYILVFMLAKYNNSCRLYLYVDMNNYNNRVMMCLKNEKYKNLIYYLKFKTHNLH